MRRLWGEGWTKVAVRVGRGGEEGGEKREADSKARRRWSVAVVCHLAIIHRPVPVLLQPRDGLLPQRDCSPARDTHLLQLVCQCVELAVVVSRNVFDLEASKRQVVRQLALRVERSGVERLTNLQDELEGVKTEGWLHSTQYIGC